MSFIIANLEDKDVAVLETVDGETIYVPRGHLPAEAKERDTVHELPEAEWVGEVRYDLDTPATTDRLGRAP